MNFGLYDPRFREQKIKKKKAVAVGPHVMLDQERCILCSRCVRFTDEISKTGEFGIFNRGDQAEVALYPGQNLDNPYSGNVVDICPVGALTDRDRKSTRLNSSHVSISYAVFCLKKKKNNKTNTISPSKP